MISLPADPGRDWLEIISRPTLAAFSAALSIDPVLTASVLHASIVGAVRIRSFFEATRAMYDHIAFTRETKVNGDSLLEWAGGYHCAPIEGVTILERDAEGMIARIRLLHLPYDQLVAFADELTTRLAIRSTREGSLT